MRLVRWLAWSVGLLFLVGTALQLVDFFDLYTAPPDIPESLNMVERRLAIQDYRVAIWPVFLLSNLATGVGFMAVTALGLALSGHVGRDDSRRVGIAAGLGGLRCERQFAPGGHRCRPRHGGDLRRRGPAADHRRDAAHDR